MNAPEIGPLLEAAIKATIAFRENKGSLNDMLKAKAAVWDAYNGLVDYTTELEENVARNSTARRWIDNMKHAGKGASR